MTEKMQQAFAKNIHWVQNLNPHYIGVIKFIAPLVTHNVTFPPASADVLNQFHEGLTESIQRYGLSFAFNKSRDLDDHEICRGHSQLESLIVCGCVDGTEEYLFLEFLKSCSRSLRIINQPKSARLTNKSLYQVVHQFSLHMNINLHSLFGLTDFSLADIVPLPHSWTSIDMQIGSVGHLTAEAIEIHCHELKELNMACGRALRTSSAFQGILCKATKLIRLFANYDCDEGTPENSQLLVMDILGVLTQLEELHLSSFAIDLFEEGSWINSEELDATRYLDPLFQLACLEMRLASGMDLLSVLEKLRVQNVTRMAIALASLNWNE
ncbi:hypothetical protein BGZ93_005011 [Podila epicladia]|nr:hypothetical protein BGZ93_005011 [Podila epicladia]